LTWLEIGKLLIAGLAGGAIVPYLTNIRDRRVARAAVAEQLAVVEGARWAGSGTWAEFIKAITVFEAKAMIAGIPRPVVDHYTRLARVGRATSEADVERTGGIEHSGGIGMKLSEVIKAARDLIVDHVWHPHTAFLRRTAALATIEEDVQKAIDNPNATGLARVDWWHWTSRE